MKQQPKVLNHWEAERQARQSRALAFIWTVIVVLIVGGLALAFVADEHWLKAVGGILTVNGFLLLGLLLLSKS